MTNNDFIQSTNITKQQETLMLTSELSVATYTKQQMCPGRDPEGEHSRGITVSDCR